GSVWGEYVTRFSGNSWSMAAWVPRSNNVLDNRPAIAAGNEDLTLVYSRDGRGEMNPAKVPDPHMQGQSDADAPNYDDVLPSEAYVQAGASDDEAAKPGANPEPAAPATTEPADGASPGRRRRGGGNGARRRNL